MLTPPLMWLHSFWWYIAGTEPLFKHYFTKSHGIVFLAFPISTTILLCFLFLLTNFPVLHWAKFNRWFILLPEKHTVTHLAVHLHNSALSAKWNSEHTTTNKKKNSVLKCGYFFLKVGHKLNRKSKVKHKFRSYCCNLVVINRPKKKKYFPTYSNPHVSDPHLTGSNAICLLYEGIGQTKISIHTWGLNSLEQFGKTREDVA